MCPAGEHRVFHMDYSLLLFYVQNLSPYLTELEHLFPAPGY